MFLIFEIPIFLILFLLCGVIALPKIIINSILSEIFVIIGSIMLLLIVIILVWSIYKNFGNNKISSILNLFTLLLLIPFWGTILELIYFDKNNTLPFSEYDLYLQNIIFLLYTALFILVPFFLSFKFAKQKRIKFILNTVPVILFVINFILLQNVCIESYNNYTDEMYRNKGITYIVTSDTDVCIFSDTNKKIKYPAFSPIKKINGLLKKGDIVYGNDISGYTVDYVEVSNGEFAGFVPIDSLRVQ